VFKLPSYHRHGILSWWLNGIRPNTDW
jgi:hypothetical protein